MDDDAWLAAVRSSRRWLHAGETTKLWTSQVLRAIQILDKPVLGRRTIVGKDTTTEYAIIPVHMGKTQHGYRRGRFGGRRMKAWDCTE